MWENIASLGAILSDAGLHWFFSASLGLLVFCLILIISRVLARWLKVGWSEVSTGAKRLILLLAILLGVLVGLGSHYCLDWLVAWYNTPLAPPLDIELRWVKG
jgi:uncharacterized membrane protein YoaK (UPF0700 family)